MATGISKCRKCFKEFKWYRNKEYGPAKYCSKKCKDEDHSFWCKKTQRKNIFICEQCGNKFKRRTSLNQKQPRFCTIPCRSKNVHTWNSKGKYRIDLASEEMRFNRLKDHYEKQVIKTEGCWEWKGSLHKSGYAVIKYGRKQMMAHRASWMIHKNEIPKGMNILHSCDVRSCTNPDHLWLGTHKENMIDRDNKGRQCKGSKNWFSILKESQVLEIKKLLELGVPCSKIAPQFGVGMQCIWNIKAKRSWKHLE